MYQYDENGKKIPIVEHYIPPTGAQTTPNKKDDKKKWISIILIIVGSIALIVALYLLFKPSKVAPAAAVVPSATPMGYGHKQRYGFRFF